MSPDDFKLLLRTVPSAEIVDTYLINDDPGPYISCDALDFLQREIRLALGIDEKHQLATIVVGSAKLGFAYLDKRGHNGGGYKPAYRSYQPGTSDIDVAVVSPVLYGKIWQELARHGTGKHNFPWRTDDLGHYMLHGWLRPDKFPPEAPLICTSWKSVINDVSRSQYFMYKNLRCGIYHSRYFLKIYQQRGIIAAQQAESAI